jgi:hypothetical protein
MRREAFARFDRLPYSLKNKVYEILYHIHSEEGKLPSQAPPHYGEQAFHAQGTATDAERAEALSLVYPVLLHDFKLEDLCFPEIR